MNGCTYVPMDVVNAITLCLNCVPMIGILSTIFMKNYYREHEMEPWFVIIIWLIILIGFNWAIFSSTAPSPDTCSYIINR